MTTFAGLTPQQQQQAAFLFADEIFGTDPNLFDYELNGEMVVARCQVSGARCLEDRKHARKPRSMAINVMMSDVPDGMITLEMERRSTIAIQQLARRIVGRMITVQQSQEA